MEKEKELPVGRILEVAEAVNLIRENNHLDGVVTYRVGRLGDATKSPSKTYFRLKESKRKEVYEKQTKLQKGVGITDESKREVALEVGKLNVEFNDEVDKMLDELEKIKVPTLKLSDFIAKEEKKIIETVGKGEDQKKIEVIIKPGQSLVPVQFFTLMGDLITDDKS